MSRYNRRIRTSETSREEKKEGRNYLAAALGSLIFTIPLTYLLTDLIPFRFLEVWDMHGTGFVDWMTVGWPMFLWGLVVQTALIIAKWPKFKMDSKGEAAGDLFIGGIILSFFAGITEELAFRWLSFYGAFLGLFLGNFFFFDFLGFGVGEWFHLSVWGPIANWTTFGYLEGWIFHPTTWLVGAAMLTVNAFFRDGHKYQGILGWTNSWFLGMYFFYIMFTHGLLAAMIVHTIYDIIVFSTVAGAVALAQPRKKGWQNV